MKRLTHGLMLAMVLVFAITMGVTSKRIRFVDVQENEQVERGEIAVALREASAAPPEPLLLKSPLKS